MTPIYVNGKFAAQRTTGVQRVASQLLQALDALLSDDPGVRWTLLCPPGAKTPALRRIECREVGWPGLPLHAWEQLILPTAARDGLLVNLAGSAPWLARRQAAVLHDAAVFDCPHAYTAPFVWWYQRLFRRLAARDDTLFTVSAFSRLRLSERLRVPPSRIAVLPNGAEHLDTVVADEAVLDRHGLRGHRYLLAVGSANPTKNLQALATAFARLSRHDPQLRLVLVGGRHAKVFAPGAAPAPQPGLLQLGHQDDASLKALYQHAAALVFPSTYEGFGLPPLEAMACRCPVAAAHAAALPETCGDAVLYFDPASVDELEAALARMLGDTTLQASLRRAGTTQAARFRWSRSARILRDTLSSAEATA